MRGGCWDWKTNFGGQVSAKVEGARWGGQTKRRNPGCSCRLQAAASFLDDINPTTPAGGNPEGRWEGGGGRGGLSRETQDHFSTPPSVSNHQSISKTTRNLPRPSATDHQSALAIA